MTVTGEILLHMVERGLLFLALALGVCGLLLVFWQHRLQPRLIALGAVREAARLHFLLKTLVYLVFALQILLTIDHTLLVRRLPFANIYDFMLLLPLVIFGVAVYVYRRRRVEGLFPIFLLLSVIFNLGCIFMGTTPSELQPILQSGWLPIHVFSAMIAYSVFAIAFIYALQGLTRDTLKAGKTEKECYYLIRRLGLPALTFAILTGAIWAEAAWGSYWSWDPKETWALVTWGIYMLYLHLRRSKKISPRLACMIVIIGFLAVIFTFFGVSYLLPGLHAYK